MEPSSVFSLTVVWMVEPLAGVTVSVPSEPTAVVYGRLSTVMLVTPVTPRTLLVQLLLSKVCAPTDSVAVPGAAGVSVARGGERRGGRGPPPGAGARGGHA